MEKLWLDVKELLEEEIKKIIKKGEISPTELVNLEKAVCLSAYIEEKFSGEGGMEASYGYSGYGSSNGYYGQNDNMYSGRRGRSRTTGRYVSRGMDPGYEMYENDMRFSRGMSGHSINDRMVAKLEEMYDSAKTEHERETVEKWIKRLEAER